MRIRKIALAVLLGSTTALSAVSVAQAQETAARQAKFAIPAGDLVAALRTFARQSRVEVIYNAAELRGRRTAGVQGTLAADEALRRLLAGANTEMVRDPSGALLVRPVGNAEGGEAAYAPEEIIVTAQKRVESIQNVPISVSAFSAQALDEQKIEGGSELVRAVPNVSFSKTNFASYNFSIRGVGTKALSVASDPAVAISFNNTPLIRNRLFEQEYFDVQRVEVLRGPQGTLYGRNATGGVVNMIPNIAKPGEFEGDLQLEAGNYGSMRAKGMLNVPLGDTLAVRVAGAWTSRDGYDFNTVTNRRVNGRDLWSTRASAAWEPSDSFRVNAIWEHFNENDDRSRTGKQLCTRDPGPASVGSVDISAKPLVRGLLSQGCQDSSLYDDAAFGAPNGFALPYITAGVTQISLGYDKNSDGSANSAKLFNLMDEIDPYVGIVQSRNLREISTSYDPTFRAKNDVFQLNAELSISQDIVLYSQTSYSRDRYNSTQDYNRFIAGPAFNDSAETVDYLGQPNVGISPGGMLIDPQLGPSDTVLGVDQVKSKSSQWYQEFRLQSSFDGPINFTAGANYLKFKIDEDYYVFNNLFTAVARAVFGGGQSSFPVRDCQNYVSQNDFDGCTYTDPNPLNQIDGDGHNYFRSRNINKTRSKAIFGEIYWNLTDNLKLTSGFRLTEDEKVATPINTQLLLGTGYIHSGFVNFGYRVSPDIKQKWTRLTGRMVLDWKPDIDFTDNTLIYASYARGYKGGGANPPGIDGNPELLQFFPLPTTFRPEGVNAFEIGMKNSFGNGRFTLNANAFLYDYTDYQVSQIVDRLALNENYDAKMWGAELELAWRPTSRFRANANFGYLGTRIDKGMKSIDVMNRTQGNPDWVLVKPWLQVASNCIAPKALVEQVLSKPAFTTSPQTGLYPMCGASWFGDYRPGSFTSMIYGIEYDPATDAPNQGRGFDADLGGNELPNAPHWTVNLGAQYTLPVNDWDITLRGDYYRQAKSWARVYNTAIDRLKSWDNANVSLTVERPDSGLAFQFYIKNLFNKTPITDAFLNSDDSGLTANVFTLDPRIIGFSASKKF